MLEAEETIGGGTRSGELTVPGLLHDHCSAVHPMAVGSPFLRSLELERYGLEWRWPEVDLAHPLDDGSAGVMLRSIDETARGLGRRRRGLAAGVRPAGALASTCLAEDIFRPFLHVPRHPLRLVALRPARRRAGDRAGPRLADTPGARALRRRRRARLQPAHPADELGGRNGADLRLPPLRLGGGARRLAARSPTRSPRTLREHGGQDRDRRRRVAASSPRPTLVVLDLAPARRRRHRRRPPARPASPARTAATGTGPAPSRSTSRWRGACRGRTRPAAGPARSTAAGRSRRSSPPSATSTAAGCPSGRSSWSASSTWRIPERSNGDVHPVWAYAHVPHGYDGDADRGAHRPDRALRAGVARADRRRRRCARRPSSSADNANYIGGDIITGANTPVQVLIRPRLALDPYSTGIPGVYICSAATPPGRGRARDERLQRGAVGASLAERPLRAVAMARFAIKRSATARLRRVRRPRGSRRRTRRRGGVR